MFSTYGLLIAAHLLGATIWIGGHLILAFTVLPRALRARQMSIVQEFEGGFERIGIPALILQVVTGVWLATLRVGGVSAWFESTPLAHVVQVKLVCLLLTVVLAVHARLVIIPKLTNERLPTLAMHIIPVTLISVVLAVFGASFRFGGF